MSVSEHATGSASLLNAIEETRRTARWMLATLGAVAGALLVGGNLSDLSRIHDSTGRLLAVIGAVLALAGVASAIFAVARVLVPVRGPRNEGGPLADPRLEALIAHDKSLLSGLAESLEELQDLHLRTLKAFREAERALAADNSAGVHARPIAAQSELKAIEPTFQYLRDVLLYEEVSGRFATAVWVLAAASFAAIGGALLFAAGLAC